MFDDKTREFVNIFYVPDVIKTDSFLKNNFEQFKTLNQDLFLIESIKNENFTHKYFLHMKKVNHNSIFYFINKFADEIHYLHHKDPKDLNYIFAQIWLTLPALFFYTFIFYISTNLYW